MNIDTPALRHLERLGVDFEVTHHGRVRSLEEAAAARGIDPDDLIKTMVVRRGPDDYVLVLVPGMRVIAWPRLRALLGVNRLSMPDADEAQEVTGYARGTITPFGTKSPLPVIADARIAGRKVSIGGGDHGVGVTIDGDELIRITEATTADVTDPA
ncbi:MAG TPA: YbaK/EbsC family protein [Acidimicrobiia bacterium]|jgi:Cys-tRNA(Pro)/Cys-tRNA(Cys) deacylase|nr:YbaK/EbsC family protein [Acidimicrobiia bacterium]